MKIDTDQQNDQVINKGEQNNTIKRMYRLSKKEKVVIIYNYNHKTNKNQLPIFVQKKKIETRFGNNL